MFKEIETVEKAIRTQLEDIKNCGISIYCDGYDKGYQKCAHDLENLVDNAEKDAYDRGYMDGAECQNEEQYQQGLEDMWNAFHVAYELSDDQMEAVLDDIWFSSIFRKYTPAEFVRMIEDWKQKQEEQQTDDFKVGDEVTDYQGNIFYVVDICDGDIRCWNKEGKSVLLVDGGLKKTGKHIDGIAEVLKQMQE